MSVVDDPRTAYLIRAREWLKDPTPEAIRYAALEVRFLIEELTYEKLRSASDIIPPGVLRTWQPPQAVKALLEFDEFADQSFEVHVGKHPPDSDTEQEWLPLGSHHALTLQWIRKNYNRAGNLLHAPSPGDKAPADAASSAKALAQMVDELTLALASGIKTMSLRGGFTFPCQNCGKLVLRNLKALQSGKTALCSAPNCGAGYRLARMDGDLPQMLRAVVRLKCLRCADEMAVDEGKVAIGVVLRCSKCDQRHQIVAHQWGYNEASDATTNEG